MGREKPTTLDSKRYPLHTVAKRVPECDGNLSLNNNTPGYSLVVVITPSLCLENYPI
ncbi:hypothetical protein J6590_068846 [Homalodisca vitripennis]|nr:hypothetical protein J6590_068846 [Homalodisca vitripennis]